MRNFIIRCVFFSFLLSCSNSIKYPSWYFNSNSDEKFYRSSGVGMSKEIAISQALNIISSQLQVTVSSEFEHEEYMKDGKFEEKIKNFNSFVTENFKFTQYQIENQSKLSNGDTAILISVNKETLYKNIIYDIENLIKKINQTSRLTKNYDIGKKIKLSLETRANLEKISYLLSILKSIKNDPYVISKYNSFVNMNNEKNEKILLNTTFVIKSNDPYLSNIIFEKINEYGLTAIDDLEKKNYKCTKNDCVYLIVNVDKKYKTLFDNIILNANLNIHIKSLNQSTNFSINHSMISDSSVSNDMADKKLYLKIAEKIDYEKLSFFGI